MRILFLLFYSVLLSSTLFAQAPNDSLCNAIAIAVDETCSDDKQIDLTNATIEANEPNISCLSTPDTTITASVWFRFAAPESDVFIVAEADDKADPSLDFQMQLFTLEGSCDDLSNLVPQACATSFTNILESPTLLTSLTAGAIYYIQISGNRFADMPPFVSTGCLTISSVNTPANDAVCDATNLMVDAEPQVFSNVGATVQENEATIAPPISMLNPFGFVGQDGWASGDASIEHSVWFTFTTPEGGGNFAVDLRPSFGVAGNFNTQLAVYNASDCNDFASFELVAAADNGLPTASIGAVTAFSTIELFCLEGETTYHILVDGGNSFLFAPTPNQGNFAIQVRELVTDALSVNTLVEGPTCEGDTDGTILIAATGGAGGYDYRWNTGDSIPEFVGTLAAETYTLTLTDQCGVEVVETIEVPTSLRNDPMANIEVEGTTCEGEEVTLTADVSGGLRIDEERLFIQTFVGFGVRGLSKINLETPSVNTTVTDTQSVSFNHLEFVGDQLYGTDANNQFYAIDAENGTFEVIDSLNVSSITGLSYVPSLATLFVIDNNGRVFEVDPSNASLTFAFSLNLSTARAAIVRNGSMVLLGTDGFWYESAFSERTLRQVGFFGANTLPVTALEVDPNNGRVYYTVSRILAQQTETRGWQAITELNINTGETVRVINSFSNRPLSLAIRPSDVQPYGYEWTSTAMLSDTSSATSSFVITEETSVMLTATDACGVMAMDERMIEAFPDVATTIDTTLRSGEMYGDILIENDTTIIENLSTVNGCDSIVTINVMIDISNTRTTWAETAIQISPNPTNNLLNINTLGIEERQVDLRIIDLQGRVIWQQNNAQKQMDIDVSALLNGMYFLEIRSAERFAMRQFIKM
ncbi:MAG: T9SS type A sorting domain-containing protein [Bacteroidota bacterium]